MILIDQVDERVLIARLFSWLQSSRNTVQCSTTRRYVRRSTYLCNIPEIHPSRVGGVRRMILLTTAYITCPLSVLLVHTVAQYSTEDGLHVASPILTEFRVFLYLS